MHPAKLLFSSVTEEETLDTGVVPRKKETTVLEIFSDEESDTEDYSNWRRNEEIWLAAGDIEEVLDVEESSYESSPHRRQIISGDELYS